MNQRTATAKCLGVVVVVQTLLLLSLWAGGPAAGVARADGIPDAGAQREDILNQLKATNAKLDALTALLSGGKLEVTVRKPTESGR